MGKAIEGILAITLEPFLMGLLVFAFTYPVGQMIMQARGRSGVQAWWTWVLGMGFAAAIQMITGRSIL